MSMIIEDKTTLVASTKNGAASADNPTPLLAFAQSDGLALTEREVESQGFTQYGEAWTVLALLETLLFVSDGPVEVSQLAKTLNLKSETIVQNLQQLDQYYIDKGRGLRVQEYNGKFQLVTNAKLAPLVETFLQIDLSTKLSTPALETLAIIAYRQPVTRAQIEAVRGVDSSAMLRSLVQRGLIQESGRLEGIGRPLLYSVTENFMHYFGLTGLNELPTLETTEADTLWATTVLAENQEAA